MTSNQKDILISKAIEYRDKGENMPLSDDPVFDEKIKALHQTYPHLFVLCCLMDRQINAEKAWHIPYEICVTP